MNHIDSNRMNPALENLEYVTRTENAIHAARYGRKCPLTEDDVRRIRELYAIWNFTKRVSAGTFDGGLSATSSTTGAGLSRQRQERSHAGSPAACRSSGRVRRLGLVRPGGQQWLL